LNSWAKLKRCRTSGSAPFSQRPFCQEVPPDTGKSTSVRTRTRGSWSESVLAQPDLGARERRNLIANSIATTMP
jgi:hypothetical protein